MDPQAHDAPVVRASRIRALQEMEGLTQADLASIMGISQPYVSAILHRRRPMPPHAAEALQLRFSLPSSFFSVKADPLDDVAPTFRKKAGASARSESRIVRLAREAARLWDEAAERTGLPRSPLLSIEATADPEQAAIEARRMAGIQDSSPVRNAIRAAERLGVAVIRRLDPAGEPLEGRQHEGISLPTSRCSHPIAALSAPLPADRARLTIAHEIGHLVYDRDREAVAGTVRSPEERRAFDFAGAFLIPAPELASRVDETTSLADFARIKAEWGVSAGALIKRARRLGLVSAGRERSLWIQYSSRGWRKGEPVDVAEERPILLGQAVSRAWPVDTAVSAARDSGIPWRWATVWSELADIGESGGEEPISLDRYRREKAAV